MLQLDLGRGSAGTLLELCWKAAVAAVVGGAESFERSVDRKHLAEPCWLSNETRSRKLGKTSASVGYEGKRDCLLARKQRIVWYWMAKRDSPG